MLAPQNICICFTYLAFRKQHKLFCGLGAAWNLFHILYWGLSTSTLNAQHNRSNDSSSINFSCWLFWSWHMSSTHQRKSCTNAKSSQPALKPGWFSIELTYTPGSMHLASRAPISTSYEPGWKVEWLQNYHQVWLGMNSWSWKAQLEDVLLFTGSYQLYAWRLLVLQQFYRFCKEHIEAQAGTL